MKLSKTAAVLWMSFSAASCSTTQRVVEPLRPDVSNPERFVCEPAGTRPTIPPEYAIDWAHVTTVPQARAEHDAYVRSIRTREGVVAGYIVSLEGKHFVCVNNLTWQREFYGGLHAAD